jgi:hypothetical protein
MGMSKGMEGSQRSFLIPPAGTHAVGNDAEGKERALMALGKEEVGGIFLGFYVSVGIDSLPKAGLAGRGAHRVEGKALYGRERER